MQEGEWWEHVPFFSLFFILLYLGFLSLGMKFGKHRGLSAFSLERGAPHGSSLISKLLLFPPFLSQSHCSCQLQTLSCFPDTIYPPSGSALSLHPSQRKLKLLSCSSPAQKTAPTKSPLARISLLSFTWTPFIRRWRAIENCECLFRITMR